MPECWKIHKGLERGLLSITVKIETHLTNFSEKLRLKPVVTSSKSLCQITDTLCGEHYLTFKDLEKSIDKLEKEIL